MFKYIVIALLVVSCASAEKVILPDGREGYSLECPEKPQCYKKARETCKGNYDILETGTTGGQYPKITYTIACKK